MIRTMFSRALPCMLLSTTLTLAVANLAHAGGGTPPNGKYNCTKINSSGQLMSLGTLEIKGNTYRGIGDEGGFAAYTVGGDGNITWSKGLTGMPDGWKVTSSNYDGPNSSGQPVIKINYMSPRSAAEVMDCVRE